MTLLSLLTKGFVAQLGALIPLEASATGPLFPRGPIYEGLIIDDYVCLRIHPRSERSSGASPDAQLMAAAADAYAKANLEEASEKRVLQQRTFTVWGTSVDSATGRVGAPPLIDVGFSHGWAFMSLSAALSRPAWPTASWPSLSTLSCIGESVWRFSTDGLVGVGCSQTREGSPCPPTSGTS